MELHTRNLINPGGVELGDKKGGCIEEKTFRQHTTITKTKTRKKQNKHKKPPRDLFFG
jgi:hypothetical protein